MKAHKADLGIHTAGRGWEQPCRQTGEIGRWLLNQEQPRRGLLVRAGELLVEQHFMQDT